MQIPKYWSSAFIETKRNGSAVKIWRLGWSDVSELEAKEHAQDRAIEAGVQLEAGQKIRYFERDAPYNGADGVPIKEETIAEHQRAIVTRNSYGALCLNTPDVLFADVDFEDGINVSDYNRLTILTFIAISAELVLMQKVGVNNILIALPILTFLAYLGAIFVMRNVYHPKQKALRTIRQFSQEHPDWLMRVYRTPAGYRVLVMHKHFDPNSAETHTFLTALNSDPLYIRMCQNQRCFRARVSPKPWRMGLSERIPFAGRWPLKEGEAAREKWVVTYRNMSKEYASCRLETVLGEGKSHPDIAYLQQIHDGYCQSDSDLPIA